MVGVPASSALSLLDATYPLTAGGAREESPSIAGSVSWRKSLVDCHGAAIYPIWLEHLNYNAALAHSRCV